MIYKSNALIEQMELVLYMSTLHRVTSYLTKPITDADFMIAHKYTCIYV